MKNVNDMTKDELIAALDTIRVQRRTNMEYKKRKKKTSQVDKILDGISTDDAVLLIELLKKEGMEM